MGFFQGRLAIGEAMAPPVIRAVRRAVRPGGVILLDAPPGTSCPAVASIRGADVAMLVTEPTPFGCSDLGAAVETCRALGVPCGVVVNRAGVGDRSAHDYCKAEGLPLLAEIPWRRSIAEAYARGRTLVDAGPEWVEALCDLYERITRIAEGM